MAKTMTSQVLMKSTPGTSGPIAFKFSEKVWSVRVKPKVSSHLHQPTEH